MSDEKEAAERVCGDSPAVTGAANDTAECQPFLKRSLPVVIQGGMGIGVSGWQLARAVSQLGQLGVVSGTALDGVLVRRLQTGDAGGHVRRALGHFPDRRIASDVLAHYFVEGGLADGQPFVSLSMPAVDWSDARQALNVVAGFVEVFLAKEGHSGVVGINLLEKIQLPIPATLYGAMLAGVDYVLVGAGIPRELPGTLDLLAEHRSVGPRLRVAGATNDDDYRMPFDPCLLDVPRSSPLRRPHFLAIIASATLAITLARKANGRVDGFVIEGPIAGGHNAPPRANGGRNTRGEPIYGPRDEVELDKIRALGLPFWLAGGYGTFERLRSALALGAAGVQVGTAFALCRESGMAAALKARLIALIREGRADVFTDPQASPTGFPFKIGQMAGSLSEDSVVRTRQRSCDLGYLREPYKKANGALGYRCSAEPLEAFTDKGGAIESTEKRLCLCNGLMATIGLGQRRRARGSEPPLITAGDDLRDLARLLTHADSYGAADVVRCLLGIAPAETEPLDLAAGACL